VIAELGAMANVALMPRTTVFGWYDGNIFGAAERVNDHARTFVIRARQRYWRIIAKKAVLAAERRNVPSSLAAMMFQA
jgi:sarcosine oxidase subunit alpha